MATASYTLKSNGQAVFNDLVNIANEWWTTAPKDNIGSFYQVKATIINQSTPDNGTIEGVFGNWISISENRTWTLSSDTSLEGVEILFQIRRTLSNQIESQANIILGTFDIPSGGWSPDLEFKDDVGVDVVYSDSNLIATIVSYGNATRVFLGASSEKNAGKLYIEFKIINGAASLPQFDPIQVQLIQAGLMPSTLRVSDAIVPSDTKVVGTRFETDTFIPSQGVYSRTYENQITLPTGTKTAYGLTGDVIAFAIDFDNLDWFVYKNNVLISNFQDFGIGDSFGTIQPSIHLPTPTLWSVRLQETTATQDFAPPAGFTPWSD